MLTQLFHVKYLNATDTRGERHAVIDVHGNKKIIPWNYEKSGTDVRLDAIRQAFGYKLVSFTVIETSSKSWVFSSSNYTHESMEA